MKKRKPLRKGAANVAPGDTGDFALFDPGTMEIFNSSQIRRLNEGADKLRSLASSLHDGTASEFEQRVLAMILLRAADAWSNGALDEARRVRVVQALPLPAAPDYAPQADRDRLMCEEIEKVVAEKNCTLAAAYLKVGKKWRLKPDSVKKARGRFIRRQQLGTTSS
jgi:hypothetical protein